MQRNALTLIFGTVVILIFGLLLFTFQVRQSEMAVVTTFGQPTGEITAPRAFPFFKWPWPIQKVHKFDRRIQTYEEVDKFTEDLTADGNTLITKVYVGWRITDPQVFFPKFAGGSVVEAKKMLESLVRSAKSAVVGRHPFSDFINTDPEQLKFSAIETEIKTLVQSQLETNQCGIQVEFLGIKKLGLPESVTQAVFERMTSERKLLADNLDSEGLAESAKIRSAADRKANEMLATAEAEATRIIGRGEAAAAEVLPVFEQNPELANFLLRLKTIESSLKERTTLVLDQQVPPLDLFRTIKTAPATK